MFGFLSPLLAADYDLKEITPAVQAALSGRQARFNDLQQRKAAGAVGENNQGFVQVLQDSAGAGTIAGEENRDREVIYRAIVDQNGLGPSGVSQVEEVFAEVQRGKARAGERIQLRSGEWVQK